MAVAAQALAEPTVIKISSKRQITIPAKIYEREGFAEYALATWTDDGLLIQPLQVDDEDLTLDILRYLIDQGFDGDELIEQYMVMKRKIIPFKRKLEEAEQAIAEGRVYPAQESIDRLREKYGLQRPQD